MTTQFDGLFSREMLAGYEPTILARSRVVLVGAGAAGNNIALNLALAGLGELLVVDPDSVEDSNLTRSPLFVHAPTASRTRHKAREVAGGFRQFSYDEGAIIRHAVAKIEDLGLGALFGASVVISAADVWSVRAYLADATRLLGIPLIEIGFFGHEGQVSVWPNCDANEPCWRCLHPRTTNGGVGCQLYARAVTDSGKTPATQPLAAVFGALAAEATLQALHGKFSLANASFHLNIHSGDSSFIKVARDPDCPGVHRNWPPPLELESRSTTTVKQILVELAQTVEDPIIHLPSPFIVRAPCDRCGRAVDVNAPSSAVTAPPACKKCDPEVAAAPVPVASATTIQQGDALANRQARRVGLRIGDMFEVESGATGECVVAKLAGSAEDIYTTLRRKVGNASVESDMSLVEAASLGEENK